MVSTFLYCFRILVPVLGDPDYCEGVCVAEIVSERWLQQSSPKHDNRSGCLDLVSCDGSRSPEASRD